MIKRNRLVSLILCSFLAISGRVLYSADLTYPFAESSLNGLVKSEKGEALEGIIVRAQKDKSHIGYSVASDAQGKYRFPKLEPGQYMVEIARADGLEPGRQNAEIKAGQESRADFALGPAKVMEDQMTSVDWLLNLPGTPEQVKLIDNSCIHCHTGTPLRFRFDKENWAKIVRLMTGTIIHSAQWGMATHVPRPGAKPNRELPGFEEKVQVLAEYLAQVRGPKPIDLSKAKILPRPTGRSTRVMFTEYTIPYPNAELHDMGVDKYGMVWWTDWRWPYIGRLNPETGEMKYWESPVPQGKAEVHPGSQELDFDAEENLWTSYSWTGGALMFDRKTEKFTSWMFPDQKPRRLMNSTFDAKRHRMWFGTDDYYGKDEGGYYDPKTGEYRIFPKFPAYGQVTDSKGNHYGMLRGDGMSHIGRIDGETLERIDYPTPTPGAYPRRGDYDSQDRIWFAEYNVNQIGMLDPKAGKITEWKIPVPMATPYGTGVDRNTDMVWVELYRPDRIVKLDPRTGDMVQYYLPERHLMARSPRMDPKSRADHNIMWMGTLPKYGNGKLIKIETW